jgi:hypothetical protein
MELIQMPNEQGRYNSTEMIATGLPVYIPSSKRWTKKPYPLAVLISRSRCTHFGAPVREQEPPAAFLYAANAGQGTGDLNHRYVPLFDRTEAFKNGIDIDKLIDREIMRADLYQQA